MTKPRFVTNWIIAGCVCLVLLCLSTLALAQDSQQGEDKLRKRTTETTQTTDVPSEELSLNYEKIKSQKKADPDRPVISGRVPNPEQRASGYLKIGDIKGESTSEGQNKTPAHTKDYKDSNPSDPGRTTARDHKDWINLDSVSGAASPAQTNKLSIATKPEAYECPDNDPECYCHGVLDCKNLWLSGECKENTEWEDSNDPSKGGCIQK